MQLLEICLKNTAPSNTVRHPKQETSTMNQARPSTIEVEGRTYQYDYESDVYYRVHDQTPETPRERWTKVAVATLMLIALVVAAPYYHSIWSSL